MTPVLIASIAGLLISMYFTLVNHGRVKADSRFLPAFCRMDESNCQSILGLKEAQLFGIPNFQIGILFYITMILFALEPDERKWMAIIAISAAALAAVVSLYLGYLLLFVIRKKCVLCLTAHALNIILFILLLP